MLVIKMNKQNQELANEKILDSEIDETENETIEQSQEQNNQSKDKKSEYIISVIFTQVIVSTAIILIVVLAKNVGGNLFSNIKLDFESLMSYTMTKDDFVDTFSNFKEFIFGEDERQNVLSDNVSQAYDDVQTDIQETTWHTTTQVTTNYVSSNLDDIQVLELSDEELEIEIETTTQAYVSFYETTPIVNPIENPVYSSHFGYRDDPFTGEESFHAGVDIAADTGTDIRAAFSGTVTKTGDDETAGLYIYLEHEDGLVTFYCHCSEILVDVGDEILQGETIAKVGQTGSATGPHVHFEIRLDGESVDPMWLLA